MTHIRSSTLFFTILLLLNGGTSAAQQPDAPRLRWPLPPEKARIEFLYSISGKSDLGITRSFFESIWDFIVGRDDKEERIVQPAGVVADGQGRIYVTDPGARCVHVFDTREKDYSQITETGSGTFVWPLGIARANDGTLYVCDALRREVAVLSSDGTPIRSIRHRFERPTGVAVKSGKLYVVDTPRHEISVFDLGGNFLFAFGERGSGPGEFNFPVHIAAKNNLYVVDAMNHRVQVLEDSGRAITAFGEVGNVAGTFASPKGIAIDREDHVYVTDALFDAFQIFDSKGTILLAVGRTGSSSGEFQSPAGIFVDKEDDIYVVDSINRRVQVFHYLR